MIKINSIESPHLAEAFQRVFVNIDRISNMLSLYDKEKDDDLLRLCVVFLHANLEECLRNIIYFYRKNNWDEERLNKIPLSDFTINIKRVEKFGLGNLCQFKGQKVEDVINTSIRNYVNYLTFNYSGDIEKHLRACDINTKTIRRFYPLIDDMLKRRHIIVHNADMLPSRGKIKETDFYLCSDHDRVLNKIEKQLVLDWLSSMSEFLIKILKLALPKDGKLILQNV